MSYKIAVSINTLIHHPPLQLLYIDFFFQRLRTENKQLRHRCEMLEEESKALADRLVRGQVSRAEEEETTFFVQRELDVLRQTYLETTHQLALANEKIKQLSMLMEETVINNYSVFNIRFTHSLFL